MPEKMAPPKYQVRPICTSKHVALGVKQKGMGGYSPHQSMLASYRKLLTPNASENGAPLLHYKNTGVALKRNWRRIGVWGLPPRENFLRAMPSRTSENAFLEQERKVAIIIGLSAQIEN